jgi:hypothetical protein
MVLGTFGRPDPQVEGYGEVGQLRSLQFRAFVEVLF